METFIQENPHQRFDMHGDPVCRVAKRKLQSVNQLEQKQKRKMLVKSEPVDNNHVPYTNDNNSQDRADIIKLETLFKTCKSETDVEHTRQSQFEPYQAVQFNDIEFKTETPIFFLKDQAKDVGQEQMITMLRRKQVVLQTLTATFEAELLQQAGKFYAHGSYHDFPACINGDQCVTMRHEFRGRIPYIIMTALMFEDEYTNFILNHEPPISRRPCILCCRNQLVSFVTYVRSLKTSAAPSHPNHFPLDNMNGILLQMYRNSFGCPDGYFEEYTLRPEAGEAIIDPICRLNTSLCEVKLNPDNGRYYVDTEHMRWRPATLPLPQIGVKVQDF
jgi:hypothetical protein